ncbi:MAG: ImmA/IrrE family metallo-endopeptidase, partial [Clostridia bacterium]|nr:ImmA/IrrE family metallo-endopeptidase [Clostridia bacterium]
MQMNNSSNQNHIAAMHTFNIGDKSISVQIIDGNGWDFSQARYDCLIMLNLIACYLNAFDPAYLFSGQITIARSHEDFPRTLYGRTKEDRTILISSDNLRWSQQVYQLAHELTHYFLGTNSEEANNWFYESLAEIASLYFLERFALDMSKYHVSAFRRCSKISETFCRCLGGPSGFADSSQSSAALLL